MGNLLLESRRASDEIERSHEIDSRDDRPDDLLPARLDERRGARQGSLVVLFGSFAIVVLTSAMGMGFALSSLVFAVPRASAPSIWDRMTSNPALWALIVVDLILVVSLVVLGIRSLIVMRHRSHGMTDRRLVLRS